MNYTELDRRHKNGAKRFIDLWKEISKYHKCIKIINLNDDTDLYTLQYNESTEYTTEYITLVDGGIDLYFPLMNISDESKVNFDDDILETNLLKLFALLNNKKNFRII